MTEGRNIVSYSNGIEAYYNFLSFYMGEQYANPLLIMDKGNIINAKISFLVLFFNLGKEEMVEKDTSKIVDEELASSIEFIAKKENGTYKIGDYEEKNPANIITLIRNKFAHGAYSIDIDNGLVIINSENKTLKLNIDDLCKLVKSSINNLTLFVKTSKISKIRPVNRKVDKLGINHVSNREDAYKVLKTTKFYEYTLSSIDGKDIDSETLLYFGKMIITLEEAGDPEYAIDKFRKFFLEYGFSLDVKRIRLKDNEMEDVIKLLESMNFYMFDFESQKYLLYTKGIKRLDSNYYGKDLMVGLTHNIDFINKMYSQNEFNIMNLWGESALEFFSNMDESLVSALAAHFCSTYIYALERIYLDEEKYSLDRSEQLDFSLLDLSYIKPKKITIYDAPLKQLELEYNGKLKEIIELNKILDSKKVCLNNVRKKGITKAIDTLENSIRELTNSLVNLCFEFKELEERYNKVKEDYKVNRKYFYNRAIIEGIRNSIAHGNVCIKRFENIKDIDDMIISFQDIYEGELCFDLDVTIRDFETLFLEDNIKPIIEFLNKKDNDSLFTCQPHKYPIKKVII